MIHTAATVPGASGHLASDDGALVIAAQHDPAAFAVLHQRYVTRVYRYLRARTTNDEDAADLTQQTFLQVLTALPAFRDRGLPFAAWLFRIARNVATDAQRRQKAALVWDDLADDDLPLTLT